MDLSSGAAAVIVGLLDGPIVATHPDLQAMSLTPIGSGPAAVCSDMNEPACHHGTSIALILGGRRASAVPAIAPGCTFLSRSVFSATESFDGRTPSTSPELLAAALVEMVDAGAQLINLSAAMNQPSAANFQRLKDALDYAARRGVLVVSAAGNQRTLGSTTITRHPWVIPVTGCDLDGRPLDQSNFGAHAGRQGLGAPGLVDALTDETGRPYAFSGTSAAAAFVTGAAALLLSLHAAAGAAGVKRALLQPHAGRRPSVVPPLLNAFAAHTFLQQEMRR